jgi:Effector protein
MRAQEDQRVLRERAVAPTDGVRAARGIPVRHARTSSRQDGPLTSEKVLELQSSAGNKAVQRLLDVGGAGLAVQRKLDIARFSKAGFRGAGLKPGRRLIGQSRFADLEDALGSYHGAASRTEELAGLDRIETAADAWLKSGYRAKKHSAAKATEEGQKRAEITALITEVRTEREEILSTMDPKTAGSLAPDAAINASISTLARSLGLTVDQLKPMAGNAVKQLYVARVLEPFYIARKSGAPPGAASHVVDLMFNLGQVAAGQLPDGDTKDLVLKIQQSKIPDRNEMMHELAPKYSQGGVATDEVKPALPDWADTSRLAVTGNDDFRSKVTAMIPVIASTAVGALLLNGIGGKPDLANPKHPKTKQVVAEIQLPKVSHLQSATAGGDPRYGNAGGWAGGKGVVTFDPDSDILGNAGQVANEPWRQREPVVALFHELIHVFIAAKGGEEWTQDGEKLRLSHDAPDAEVRITGIDFKSKKKDGSGEITFPFSNPTYNPVTENEFRKQLAAAQGKQTFLPRPTYATVAGQVPLPAGPMPTT